MGPDAAWARLCSTLTKEVETLRARVQELEALCVRAHELEVENEHLRQLLGLAL